MVACCILRMSHQVLTFIIDFCSFHNGLKHLSSLKLVSILRATFWKVVMKCKIVVFLTFWARFLKIFIFEVAKFCLTRYQISNQLNSSVVVCICKIHAFNWLITCQFIQNFSSIYHPYFMYFFEIPTSGRYHRDMKALKIQASNFKHFWIYGTFNKWQIGVPCLTF